LGSPLALAFRFNANQLTEDTEVENVRFSAAPGDHLGPALHVELRELLDGLQDKANLNHILLLRIMRTT